MTRADAATPATVPDAAAEDAASARDVRAAIDQAPPRDAPSTVTPDAAAAEAAPADAQAAEVNAVLCSSLPAGPFPTTKIPGITPVKDIAFDDAGFLYWGRDTGGLMKTGADLKSTLFVPKVNLNGIRVAPSGDLYMGSDNGLERVAPNGTSRLILSSNDLLNGIDFDRDGRVYVTDFNGSHVYRYDPVADKSVAWVSGIKGTPNGLTLNRDFDTVFVSDWNGASVSTLFQIPLKPDGTPGPVKNVPLGFGGGTFDGMGADECGNIYIANSDGAGEIVRISADGSKHAAIVKRPGETLHNFLWGRGNGWSDTKLYIVSLETGLWVADIGVRNKRYR